jgi:hypothetical protein
VGVAGDAGDTLETEIEEFGLKACSLEERNEERAQAAVDMQRDLLLDSQLRQCSDIIDDSVREVWSGADEENSVAIY